jgi:hypothetical protein
VLAADTPKPSLPPAEPARVAPPEPTRLPPAQPALSVKTDVPAATAAKKTSWWRRRRTIVIAAGVIAVLIMLTALANRDRQGAATVTDDHGNTAATATVITDGTHAGTLAPAGDVDVFRVNVRANTTISAELRFGTLPRGSIVIASATGQIFDEASEAAPRVARVSYTAKDAGAYYIRVGSDKSDATGTYTIVLTTR